MEVSVKRDSTVSSQQSFVETQVRLEFRVEGLLAVDVGPHDDGPITS